MIPSAECTNEVVSFLVVALRSLIAVVVVTWKEAVLEGDTLHTPVSDSCRSAEYESDNLLVFSEEMLEVVRISTLLCFVPEFCNCVDMFFYYSLWREDVGEIGNRCNELLIRRKDLVELHLVTDIWK